jgi:hypothetical protein
VEESESTREEIRSHGCDAFKGSHLTSQRLLTSMPASSGRWTQQLPIQPGGLLVPACGLAHSVNPTVAIPASRR